MSEPIVTRSENRAGVVLSRRLEDHQAISPASSLRSWISRSSSGSIQPSSSGRAARSTSCAKTGRCSCAPPIPNTIGQKFLELATASSAPATRLVNPFDGKRDFIAVAHVRDTPLQLCRDSRRGGRVAARGARKQPAWVCAR